MTRRNARVRKPTTPCIFHKGFVTEVIDLKVDGMWKVGIGGKTPFGDLRNMFRRHHCRTINPYGDSDRCPFDKKECAYAFLDAVRLTVNARPRVPVGYFIKVAKSTAAIRADEAVERRAAAARLRRTDVHVEAAPIAFPSQDATRSDAHRLAPPAADGSHPRPGSDEGLAAGPRPIPEDPTGGAERVAVPRRGDGPLSVGDLLRGMEARPRQGRAETGGQGG